MSTLNQFVGGSTIKSIQRGVITTGTLSTATATITSVDVTKSVLHFLGYSTATTGNVYNNIAYITLTNSTTITATGFNLISVGTSAVTISWQLVEYY